MTLTRLGLDKQYLGLIPPPCPLGTLPTLVPILHGCQVDKPIPTVERILFEGQIDLSLNLVSHPAATLSFLSDSIQVMGRGGAIFANHSHWPDGSYGCSEWWSLRHQRKSTYRLRRGFLEFHISGEGISRSPKPALKSSSLYLA